MIRLSMESIKGGMKIGKPVFDDNGKLLLGRGVILSDFYLKKLEARGISGLYINDGQNDDIEPYENISDMVRGSTLKHIRDLFGSVDEIGKEVKTFSYSALKEAISSEQFQNTFRGHPVFSKLVNDADHIVDELIAGDVVLGLNSIKTFDNYTFQHSIDVAVVSIMIGRKLGLDSKRLRELGIGCLIHDIGKTFIPIEIVNKPTKLTDDEFKKMKDHPMIGFELVKDVPTIGILPPHVALQHHEKQDGSGYPRGIKGTNKASISMEPKIIHPYGSIVAVADVYDALSSDRPYRKAYSPEKVIEIMRDTAGTHLNKEVMANFLAITPVYPIGTAVRIIGGDFLYHIGIVAALNKEKLDRPIIRLVFNARRKRIDPVEVNLLERENIKLETIII